MKASASADFEDLVPDAGFSFEDFGYGTQADLDLLKDRKFPERAVKKAQLQDLWARHPIRQGEKRQYLYYVILFHSLCRIS